MHCNKFDRLSTLLTFIPPDPPLPSHRPNLSHLKDGSLAYPLLFIPRFPAMPPTYINLAAAVQAINVINNNTNINIIDNDNSISNISDTYIANHISAINNTNHAKNVDNVNDNNAIEATNLLPQYNDTYAWFFEPIISLESSNIK